MDAFLDCVIYLYPGQASAERGEKAGGSGFVAGIESAMTPGACRLYAVTNRHVVEDGKSRTISYE
jgi:S1-C subfamily serine protease